MNALRGKTGGGISIQYIFDTTTADSDPGPGKLRLNQATQNTATVIRADLVDVNGTDWTTALASLADSTSAVKGHIRLFAVSDPSKWLLFSVSAVASPSGYKNVAAAILGWSSASPFSNGDAVVLTFSRTGDAGTAGTNGLDGTNAGLRWAFATSTSMADPSSGNLRANNATLASATALAISANTGESGNPSALAFLQTFDDSTNTLKGYVLIKKVSAPQSFRVYSISALTDNTTWIQLTVAHVAGNGSFSAADLLSIEFLRAGDKGTGGGGGGSPCEFALTLVSGQPVLNSDQIAKGTLYVTPYVGNTIKVYDGASFVALVSAEMSLALDSNAGHAGYHQFAKIFDVFAYANGGTLAIGTGPAWSSGTARGTGAGTTELQQLGGIWTNKNAITLRIGVNSGDTTAVAANQATYLGSIYCPANGQTGMAFKPAAAAGGTNNVLGVYNAYNRRVRRAESRDSTANWTYTSASWRAANNSNSNRIAWLDGLGEAMVEASYTLGCATSSNAILGFAGIALDSTSVQPTGAVGIMSTSSNAFALPMACRDCFPGSLGLHYAQAVEYSTGSTTTFYCAQSVSQGALAVSLEM
jgi:hypothetical protein